MSRTARVITSSTRAAAGVWTDTSGPIVVEGLRGLGIEVGDPVVVADGEPLHAALVQAVADGVDLVVTTGGTGHTPMDLTPEMTLRVVERLSPGLAEAVRAHGVANGVPTAILSRGIAGIAGDDSHRQPARVGGRGQGRASPRCRRCCCTRIDQVHGGDHVRTPRATLVRYGVVGLVLTGSLIVLGLVMAGLAARRGRGLSVALWVVLLVAMTIQPGPGLALPERRPVVDSRGGHPRRDDPCAAFPGVGLEPPDAVRPQRQPDHAGRPIGFLRDPLRRHPPRQPASRVRSRQVAEILRADGLIAYPTDSGYALGLPQRPGRGARADPRDPRPRRAPPLHAGLPRRRARSASSPPSTTPPSARSRPRTPGPYTFILPATKDVPRRLLHPKKLTVGVRIPGGAVVPALLAAVGEPLVSSTLLLPGDEQPMTQGWEVKERLEDLVDAVVDSGSAATCRRPSSTCPAPSPRCCASAEGTPRGSL